MQGGGVFFERACTGIRLNARPHFRKSQSSFQQDARTELSLNMLREPFNRIAGGADFTYTPVWR
jgi:hypothetical protein